MNKPSLRYLSNEAIEDVTAQRIRQYRRRRGGRPFPGSGGGDHRAGLGLCRSCGTRSRSNPAR